MHNPISESADVIPFSPPTITGASVSAV